MQLTPVKVLTIICESVLEDSIITTLKNLGARGSTASDTRGEGSEGRRTDELPGQNVRIETVVSAAVAHQIIEHIQSNYFSNYGVVCFLTDAEVVRSEKYR